MTSLFAPEAGALACNGKCPIVDQERLQRIQANVQAVEDAEWELFYALSGTKLVKWAWSAFEAWCAARLGLTFAAKGAGALARVELNIGKHAVKQMAERGINESMIKAALEKGTRFIDPKNGTINYVLKEGFASGKDLLVGTNPLTGKITTVIRSTDLIAPRFIPVAPP